MTVAATIEIGSGGTLSPNLNKAQGAARGTGLATLVNQGFSHPNASGAESFLAGWKSLLASLGSDVEGFSETEAAEKQGATSVEPALVDVAGKSPAATLPSTAGAGSRMSQETERGTGPANAGLKLSQVDIRTVSSAVRSAEDLKKISSSSTEEKRSAANLESQSTRGSRPSHSVKADKPEVDATSTLPDPVSIMTTSRQIIVVTDPLTHDADALTQTVLKNAQTVTKRDLFVDPLTGSASGNFSSYSPNLGAVTRTATASAEEAVSGTEVPAAVKNVTPPVGSHVEGGNTPAASGIPAQTAALNLAQPPPQSSNQDQPLTSSASWSKPQAASPTPPETPTLGQRETLAQIGANALPVAINSDDLNVPPAVVSANASASDKLSAVSRIQGSTSPAGEKKASASEAARSSHETSHADSAQHGNHIMAAQPSGSAADASAALHPITGVTSATSELTVRASAPTSGPDSREAFTTLDAGEATGKPTWIHAGAQHAEAGFQDPALGWVGVRADTSGGGVHAELVAGTADAAQTLGGHLAGLNAYLAENHTPVETLTLSSPENGWTALGGGNGSGDGMQQEPGHQSEQDTTQSIYSGAQLTSPATSESLAWFAGRDTSTPALRLDGNHISVIA